MGGKSTVLYFHDLHLCLHWLSDHPFLSRRLAVADKCVSADMFTEGQKARMYQMWDEYRAAHQDDN